MIHVPPSELVPFTPSKRFYAVLPESFYIKQSSETVNDHLPVYNYEIESCWYRLKSGVLSACNGTLWTYDTRYTKDYKTFLTYFSDGRYGARCRARLDDRGYFWNDNSNPVELTNRDLTFLSNMLDYYPEIPNGFDGWWRFEK